MSLYVSAANALAFRDDCNLGIFWRLDLQDTDGPLRYWAGLAPVKAGIASIDGTDSVYIGAGQLVNIPELDILINGIAERVEFTLSGISDDATAQLGASPPEVTGALCHVGLAALDARWQPTTDIIPLWQGTADFWSIMQEPAKGVQAAVRTLRLSVASGDTGRSRPRRVSYSDAQQKSSHPTDKICDRVGIYARGYQVAFPRF